MCVILRIYVIFSITPFATRLQTHNFSETTPLKLPFKSKFPQKAQNSPFWAYIYRYILPLNLTIGKILSSVVRKNKYKNIFSLLIFV